MYLGVWTVVSIFDMVLVSRCWGSRHGCDRRPGCPSHIADCKCLSCPFLFNYKHYIIDHIKIIIFRSQSVRLGPFRTKWSCLFWVEAACLDTLLWYLWVSGWNFGKTISFNWVLVVYLLQLWVQRYSLSFDSLLFRPIWWFYRVVLWWLWPFFKFPHISSNWPCFLYIY